ncbi:MAG: hypothetical protein L6R37_005485 [Teloschistes peruensis]|nr:MAG: hypothetical protein L6R37_005485 [Teloschistes peruensis]
MPSATEAHHHRSSTKIAHKPFKSRHATKGFIKELSKGKIDRHEKGSRKTPHQQVMSKLDRRNQAKQLRQTKHQQNVRSTSVFAGQNGAPRIVVVVPLCADCDATMAIRQLSRSEDEHADMLVEGPRRVNVERFKQTLQYVPVGNDLVSVMNACRVADFVILLLSPEQEAGEHGEQLIRAIEGQGISNVLTMVQNLHIIQPQKKQSHIVASLKSYINHFFPDQDKVSSLDSDRECANVSRSLCTTTPKGVVWREDRSWMLVENVNWPEAEDRVEGEGEVVITGVVRGKGMKADRLVQVGDWGRFQIEKITDATLPTAKKRKADEMAMEAEATGGKVLETPDEDQDDLDELAPYDETMEDVEEMPMSEAPSQKKGILLDDHHYYSDENNIMPPPPKKFPKGTSSYQAAWFLGDMSDDDSSDSEEEPPIEEEGDIPMDPQDEPSTTNNERDPTEATPSEYPAESEAFNDPSLADDARELEAYRASRKTTAAEDREFPDEIELHPSALARERLARYRGLRSFKTSTWDTSYDKPYEPTDYDRLLTIPDYRAARKSAVREALVGGIAPGTRVNIHLRNVPLSLRSPTSQNQNEILTATSLLRHEQKRSVTHCTITLPSTSPSPLASKTRLLVQIGARRFLANPLFSQTGNTPNDVHKYLRFIHPGQTAVASFIAPVTWGSVPVLYFTLPPSSPSSSSPSPYPHLLAPGTHLPPSPTFTLAKRIILTGHPYKIHRNTVTIRHMFFNAGDVQHFAALRLFTKRGRRGVIRESLGTHGYFKAGFDGGVGMLDSVGVELFKRVWPRGAGGWMGGMGVEEVEEGVEGEEVEVVMGDE